MQNIKSFIESEGIRQLFQKNTLGIEREGHRVTPDGKLALTPHPPKVDGSATSSFIQRDFAESQLELVTPPVNSSTEVMQWLQAIHEVAVRSCENNEQLWPFSTPPALPDEEQIKVANLEYQTDIDYRNYLVDVYGKKLQMISGIHYNFELNDTFIRSWYDKQEQASDYKTFKSEIYLKLARNFLRYQWLIVYLFGATPSAHDSFYNHPSDKFSHPIRSLRNSKLGYINKSDVTYSYENLEQYAKTLKANVIEGRLIAEKEFYSNVRLRGGKTSDDLLQNGIRYLEFRLFDIQPDAPYGITAEQIEFMRYFILYLVWNDETISMDEVKLGNQIKTEVAQEDAREQTAYYEEGQKLLAGMTEMIHAIGAPVEMIDMIDEMKQRLEHPEKTPAARLYEQTKTDDAFVRFGTQLSYENYTKIWEHPYVLGGFEDMELSTQILIFDAIQQGFQIDILDHEDQMLRLSHKGHVEIIKKGNITGRDPYVSYYVMENKEVTKRILDEAGYSVPRSMTYYTKELAMRDIELYRDRAVVVKPKSTNMGIGISVFKKPADDADLKQAIDIAFSKDEAILIEDYVEGTEYRFFVLDGETKAVLLREGANVIGDGEHTIRELVDLKNNNPLRGYDHRSPLEKIAKGEEETLALKNQNLTWDAVLVKDEKVYLRENSNISTGGDSIDVTEEVHTSYKEIASQMAEALNVKITGIDLIIKDSKESAHIDNYACIEANFNPMMMMHVYPAKGEGVRLTKDILHFLFPEKAIV